METLNYIAGSRTTLWLGERNSWPCDSADCSYTEVFEKLTPWKFTDGIEYIFPEAQPVTIPGHGYLLVVKDLYAFTAKYGYMPPGVQVLHSYDGWLSNDGEKVRISMPGDLNSDGARQYICVDRVRFYDNAPWPVEADGYGKSLSRKAPTDYGNDAINWKVATPSPGIANP